MLNQTQIGFISSRCLDQFHHRQRWVRRRLYERRRLSVLWEECFEERGTWKTLLPGRARSPRLFGLANMERLVGTFLLDGSIMDLEKKCGGTQFQWGYP